MKEPCDPEVYYVDLWGFNLDSVTPLTCPDLKVEDRITCKDRWEISSQVL